MNRSELVQWLQEEYREWQALLDRIGPSRMEQPGVNGDWSMKDMVAHLTGWNRWLAARLQAAAYGQAEPPPPWPAHLQADDEINAWIYENYRGRSLHEVLEDMHHGFQQILTTVAGLPEDIPIEEVQRGERVYRLVWLNETRFPPGDFFDHFHDEHESDVRAWLARLE